MLSSSYTDIFSDNNNYLQSANYTLHISKWGSDRYVIIMAT